MRAAADQAAGARFCYAVESRIDERRRNAQRGRTARRRARRDLGQARVRRPDRNRRCDRHPGRESRRWRRRWRRQRGQRRRRLRDRGQACRCLRRERRRRQLAAGGRREPDHRVHVRARARLRTQTLSPSLTSARPIEALRRLSEPPRLRTLGEDETRRSTWLELFFDLVFVVAVAQLGRQLGLDVTAGGFFRFLAFFTPVWWAWMGFTFYANRFDTDDLPYRLFIFAAMLGVAALATHLPDAFAGASRGFVLSYVFVRLVLLALYARAIRHVKEGRAI